MDSKTYRYSKTVKKCGYDLTGCLPQTNKIAINIIEQKPQIVSGGCDLPHGYPVYNDILFL